MVRYLAVVNFDLLESLLPVFGVGFALVAVGWGVRFLRLCWVGRSPRVQIAPFSWAAKEGEREALWVTSLFRDHLKKLQLDGLDAVPDRAPGAPLVQIVEGVGQAVGPGGEWGKIMGRLWRVVWPDAAYEAWATLYPSENGSGSISIQLVRRRGGNRTLVSFTSESADWDTCAREAAMAAAGALYPHLSNRHKGPWVGWKQPVPPDLLGLYQSALEHERKHQFEQALAEFRETVEEDPLNPQLRLKVAMIEERLGLHLGAWFTYWAIVAESDLRVWRGPHRRTRLVALYRLAIHLWNPEVAKSWIETEAGDDEVRRSKLKRLRRELRYILEREDIFKGWRERNARKGDALEIASRRFGGDQIRLAAALEPFDCPDLDGREERIAEVLRIVSLDRLEELRQRMSRLQHRKGRRWPSRGCRRRPLSRWPRRSELPPLAVKASRALLLARLTEGEESRGKPYRERWPFPEWDDRSWILRLGMRAWVRLEDLRGDSWQLHYNAACTIASQIPTGSIECDQSTTSSSAWVKRAIKELESFSYHAGSPRVAAMADWIAFEDPDLDDLYGDAEFKLWGSQRFGFGLPTTRPSDEGMDRHTVLILKRSAAAFAASWRGRAATDSAQPSSLLGWWTEELEIWERLKMICRGHRNWRRRLECFRALERWNQTNEPTIDFTQEKRQHRLVAEPIQGDCLEGLRRQIDSSGAGSILGWVAGHVGRTTITTRRRSPYSTKDGLPLPLVDREAAGEAARIWTEIERELEAALRDSRRPDWSTLKPTP